MSSHLFSSAENSFVVSSSKDYIAANQAFSTISIIYLNTLYRLQESPYKKSKIIPTICLKRKVSNEQCRVQKRRHKILHELSSGIIDHNLYTN